MGQEEAMTEEESREIGCGLIEKSDVGSQAVLMTVDAFNALVAGGAL